MIIRNFKFAVSRLDSERNYTTDNYEGHHHKCNRLQKIFPDMARLCKTGRK